MTKSANRSLHAVELILILLLVPLTPSLPQNLDSITVSLEANNQPLHQVLDDLTEQSGFYFTFDSRLIDSRQRISINLEDIPVSTAIDTLFRIPGLSSRIIKKNIVVFPERARQSSASKDTTESGPHYLRVAGYITDQKSGKPLAYATIAVMDTHFGTISNEDGSFTIQLPDTIKQPILVSSYIGYKNHYTPISIESVEEVEVLMNRDLISLQEVIIRYQEPETLLKEVIRRVHHNYLDQPFGMHAYYRERVNKDSKTMLFSEAVVEIAKAPYTSPLATDRSRILKGRKVTNIELQDTVIFKIRSGLSTMLQLDIIKNPPDFLSEDFIATYDLHFSDVVSFKDKLVYVITFRPKERIAEALFRGNLYIDRETLAIIAADFEYDPVRMRYAESLFVTKKSRRVKTRPLSARYHVEYKQSGNRFHLSQVQGELFFKVRKKREWLASKYEINLEMVITRADPGNPPEITYSEQLKSSTILSEQKFEYEPEFWGDYNTIKPEASLTEALRNIEESMLEISVTE